MSWFVLRGYEKLEELGAAGICAVYLDRHQRTGDIHGQASVDALMVDDDKNWVFSALCRCPASRGR